MPTLSTEHYRAAGGKGAASRWGPKRRHNLRDLTPEQREIVNALIEAQRAANRREQDGGER